MLGGWVRSLVSTVPCVEPALVPGGLSVLTLLCLFYPASHTFCTELNQLVSYDTFEFIVSVGFFCFLSFHFMVVLFSGLFPWEVIDWRFPWLRTDL